MKISRTQKSHAGVNEALECWLEFLNHPSVYSRSLFDFNSNLTSIELDWYTDASRNATLGAGGYHKNEWFSLQWNDNFIQKYEPSINYLELFALTIGILNWVHLYPNMRITIFCDNMSVVQMINKSSSRCKNCMVLVRLIALKGMIHNVKIKAKHVRSENNEFADLLSRLKFRQFWKLADKTGKQFNKRPLKIPHELWPMEKIWLI